MISSFKKISLGSAAVLAGALFSTAASAQSTRTWVSGVGDDNNPCSRTAPCKTFTGALALTLPGGEVNCLDAGGFGVATITQSVSIICDNVEAGVLASGTDAIVVAAGPSDTVSISGLDIQGSSSALNGIKFTSGGSLRIANTRVRGFTSANYGINLSSTTPLSQVFLDNVTVTNNGTGPTGGGILVSPASNTSTTFAMTRSNVQNNGTVGLRFDTGGKTGAGIYATVDDSIFTSDAIGMWIRSPSNGNVASVTATNSIFSRNGYGVLISTANPAYFGGNTISDNTNGLFHNGTSTSISFGTNKLGGNVTDGAFTTTIGTK